MPSFDLADIGQMTPTELRAALAEVDLELSQLHQSDDGELRSLTAYEQAEFDQLMHLRSRVEAHAAVRAAAGRGRGSIQRSFGGGGSLVGASRFADVDSDDVLRMSDSDARSMALRGLESRGTDLASDSQDRVDNLVRRTLDDDENFDGSHLAKRILLTENENYRNAWRQVMTQDHPLLSDAEIRALRAMKAFEKRDLNEGSTASIAVPVFIDPSVIMTAQGSGNPFLTICRQVDVTTNVWKGVSSSGVSWSFDPEGSEVSDDSPTLLQPSATVFMARGFIPYSVEVSEDWAGFATEMTQLLAEGYDELLVDKFTRGNGTTEPQGVLTVLSASATNRVSVQTAGTNFGPDDPYRLWKQVPQRFRRRASWLMSLDVNNKIRQIATANVFHAFTANLPAEWADTLFGKSTYESPYMPDTTTSTSANSGLAIAGDFRGMVVVRRTGLQVERVNHLFGLTSNRPTGQRGWWAYARVGSTVASTSSFRLLVNTG